MQCTVNVSVKNISVESLSAELYCYIASIYQGHRIEREGFCFWSTGMGSQILIPN